MLNLRQTLCLLGLLTLIITAMALWRTPESPQLDTATLVDTTQAALVSRSEVRPISHAQSIIYPIDHQVSEDAALPTSTWISPPLNTLSNSLYDFIESEDVRYVSTEDFPFDESQREAILAFAKSGQVVMFDNSDSVYLDSYGVTESQVVSEYFGSAAAGDVILAAGVAHPQGGFHYLVLPLEQADTQETQWLNDIQQAVAMLKAEQHKRK